MSLAAVYASDKIGAALCTEMSRNGFMLDRARALAAAETLRATEARHREEANSAVGRTIKSGKSGDFSLRDLHTAFFKDLRAPVLTISEKSGKPSLGVDELRAYAAGANPNLRALSCAVLDVRRARKLRRVYIEGPIFGSEKTPPLGPDGRVHPTWMNYGAVSGRYSCQGPNLQNLPTSRTDITWTRASGGLRGLYIPAPGYKLVAFDAKQAEMRVAAYASGDEAMIAACAQKDLHSANAEAVFGAIFVGHEYATLDAKLAKSEKGEGPELTPEESERHRFLKALRNLAKSAGFAVCYLAEAETVWARIIATPEGKDVKLVQVVAMLAKLKRAFRAYFAWQEAQYEEICRTGYVHAPISGRRRWLGRRTTSHEPKPTEAANFPIQGGAADVMNEKLPRIVGRLRRASPRTKIVAQVHDSGVFEVPEKECDVVSEVCLEEFARPVRFATSGRELWATFPIDVEASERWH